MNALLLRLLFYLFVFFLLIMFYLIFYMGSGVVLAGMKYDLRRLQEIHYDVRIRGLSAKEAKQVP